MAARESKTNEDADAYRLRLRASGMNSLGGREGCSSSGREGGAWAGSGGVLGSWEETTGLERWSSTGGGGAPRRLGWKGITPRAIRSS
nr:unnamed protein product [Digitaria exilis]